MSGAASLKARRKPARNPSQDALSAPDTPTPGQIRSARLKAGLTLAQAASLAGLGAHSRWAEYESGRQAMDPVRWLYWLHVSGIKRIPFRRR